MMKKTLLFVTIFVLCISVVSFAAKKKAKYKAGPVANGGSIEGTVTFAGATVPKDETVTLTSEQKLCGDTLPAEKYIINASKQIKNVVVYIEKIGAGKAFPKKPLVVDNLMCAFVPHVSVGFRGKEVDFTNSDPVFHNVHSYVEGKTAVNLGLPEQGSKVTKRMRKYGVMEVKCDSHPWMLGYVYLLKHPYGEVTDAKGSYALSDIPPGTYNVSAWHEALGTVKKEGVKVEAGKHTTLNFEFK
jgi:plastocyanin